MSESKEHYFLHHDYRLHDAVHRSNIYMHEHGIINSSRKGYCPSPAFMSESSSDYGSMKQFLSVSEKKYAIKCSDL